MNCPRCNGNLVKDQDGDQACLQCGYQGGSTAVALVEVPLAESVYARDDLLALLADKLKGDRTLQQAAELVVAEIIEKGDADEVLRLIGAEILMELWKRNPKPTSVGTSNSGSRKVDIRQLSGSQALLESMLRVGSKWVRMGDLTFEECQKIAAQEEKEAQEHWRWSTFFNNISSKLEGGQVVSERFSDEELRVLMDGVVVS